MHELALWADDDWVSPYVFTAFVALKEKGHDFAVRPISLARGEQRAPEFVEHSLTGRVPTLRHRDYWLSESLAIVEYLEETLVGPRLLPPDPRGRARVRQAMNWLRSDLKPLYEDRPSTTLFFGPTSAPLSEAGAAAADKLVRVALALVPEGRDSIAGAWSIGDADLAFALQRLIVNGDPVPDRLVRYAENTWRRPSVRAFVAMERVRAA